MGTIQYSDLAGKTAVISGGASGIGAAIVKALLQQGLRVAFLDVDTAAGDALAQSLSATAAEFYPCDVTDTAGLAACVAQIGARFGRIDVVVNNAASDERQAFEEVTAAKWDQLIAVNLKHQYFLTQQALPFMGDHGSIVNMSSISWRRGATDVPVYAVAKAGVEGLTRMLARELGPKGIRVNALLPGMVITERQKRLWLDEKALADGLASQCLKQHVMPEDIAEAVLWLASEGARMVTGQAIVVDGGWI